MLRDIWAANGGKVRESLGQHLQLRSALPSALKWSLKAGWLPLGASTVCLKRWSVKALPSRQSDKRAFRMLLFQKRSFVEWPLVLKFVMLFKFVLLLWQVQSLTSKTLWDHNDYSESKYIYFNSTKNVKLHW